MLGILFYFLLVFPYVWFLFHKDLRFSRRKVHLYGIYGFFGLPGKGKTMCMCKYLSDMRKRYGDKIYIMTNFSYKDEDFSFKSWKQLLEEYDKPLLVAWDEIQNEFNSRDFKNFPISLLTQLTQVRKGNGIQILYTAQRWHFVDKNFRSLTFGCWECNTLLGRFTYSRCFDAVDYEQRCQAVSVDNKAKIKCSDTMKFIQTDELRNSYDSYKMLRTAKSKQYLSRVEVAKISGGGF